MFDESGSIFEGMQRKEPIAVEGTFNGERADREWTIFSEQVKRCIITNAALRKHLTDYMTQPVGEALPGEFLQAAAGADNEIRLRLTRNVGQDLLRYLSLEPVPDDQIMPDVSNAPTLKDPEFEEKILTQVFAYDKDPARALKTFLERHGDYLSKGITKAERQIILQRYRFARDAKLLALGAEIMDHVEDPHAVGNSLELPSGTAIEFLTEDDSVKADFLSPLRWNKRRQIKDRIYEVDIDGRSYILKERKTARHKDTKEHGHQDGSTSLEETHTAKFFQEVGGFEDNDIKVLWEKPLASVTYPDGFQCAFFAVEEEMEDQFIVRRKIEHLMREEYRHQFEVDYERVKARAPEYYMDPDIVRHEDDEGNQDKYVPKALAFEDYCKVKSYAMVQTARYLHDKLIADAGYDNSDLDGYQYRVLRNGHLRAEIVGFDFEYFYKDNSLDPDRLAHLEKVRKQMLKNAIFFLAWNDDELVTREQRALYFALLAERELLLGPDDV